MEYAFVTGATGLLGNNVVHALLKRNIKVKALVRSIEKKPRSSLATCLLNLSKATCSMSMPSVMPCKAVMPCFIQLPISAIVTKAESTGRNCMTLM